MGLTGLALKNVRRNPFRTILTVLGVMVAVLAFVFLRTALASWFSGVDAAAQDRLATRHKVAIVMPLPIRYFEKIKSDVPGVTAVTYANWFGGVDPTDEHDFFANFAVDPESYFDVYDDIVLSKEQLAAFEADRTGCVIGSAIAKRKGWKLGDRINLRGTIYPGDYKFTVRGIYGTKTNVIDKSTVFFSWKYFNEVVPATVKDGVSFFGIRVADPGKGPEVSAAIDKMFEGGDAETLTESERAFNMSFLSMSSAIVAALELVSIVILVIMGLILANTIAMSVRERTHEYGVMRAVGFKPHHVATLVATEGALLGLLGGALGLGFALPVVNGFGDFVEENLGSFFPYFRISPVLAMVALALAIAVGLVAATVPALLAARLRVVDALRRVG